MQKVPTLLKAPIPSSLSPVHLSECAEQFESHISVRAEPLAIQRGNDPRRGKVPYEIQYFYSFAHHSSHLTLNRGSGGIKGYR